MDGHQALGDLLDRQVRAADTVLRRLTVLRLVAEAGELDHLGTAARDADDAVEEFQALELLRSLAVTQLTTELGLAPETTLDGLLPAVGRESAIGVHGARLRLRLEELTTVRATVAHVLEARLSEHRDAHRSLPARWEAGSYGVSVSV